MSTTLLTVRLTELVNLKKSGLLTDDEFAKAKTVALADPALSALATPTPNSTESSALSNFMESHAAQRLNPWKASFKRHKEQWEAFMGRDPKELMDERRARFVQHARNRTLTTDQAMYGLYIYFSDPALVLRCLSLLVETHSPKQRIQKHNWIVFQEWSKEMQEIYGPYVEKLEIPLFPFGELDDINVSMLNEIMDAGDALEGGGVQEDLASRFFKTKKERIEGGTYQEPVFDAQGTQVLSVQMDNTDLRLHQLYEQQQKLLAEIEKLKRMKQAPPAYGRGQQQQWRGNRGRGRGQGRYMGGDTEVFSEETPKNGNGQPGAH